MCVWVGKLLAKLGNGRFIPRNRHQANDGEGGLADQLGELKLRVIALGQVGGGERWHEHLRVAQAVLAPLCGQLTKHALKGAGKAFRRAKLVGIGDVGNALFGLEKLQGSGCQTAAHQIVVRGMVHGLVENAAKVEEGVGDKRGDVGQVDVVLQVILDVGNGRFHRA